MTVGAATGSLLDQPVQQGIAVRSERRISRQRNVRHRRPREILRALGSRQYFRGKAQSKKADRREAA